MVSRMSFTTKKEMRLYSFSGSLIVTKRKMQRMRARKRKTIVSFLFFSFITYSVVSTDTLTILYQASFQLDYKHCAQPHGYAKPAGPDK